MRSRFHEQLATHDMVAPSGSHAASLGQSLKEKELQRGTQLRVNEFHWQ